MMTVLLYMVFSAMLLVIHYYILPSFIDNYRYIGFHPQLAHTFSSSLGTIASMLTCAKRLRKEFESLKQKEDDNIELSVNENNIKAWTAWIHGPPDSPYAGYRFQLRITISEEYPMIPPTIFFVTKIFHPNVHFRTGEICLDILKAEWSPAWNLLSACRAIIALLDQPAADSPLNCDAGNMLRAGDVRAFRSMARMYTVDYAIKI